MTVRGLTAGRREGHPGHPLQRVQFEDSLALLPGMTGRPEVLNTLFNLKQAQVQTIHKRDNAFVFKTLTLKKSSCNFFLPQSRPLGIEESKNII